MANEKRTIDPDPSDNADHAGREDIAAFLSMLKGTEGLVQKIACDFQLFLHYVGMAKTLLQI